jgi:hypothetical protein
MTTTSTVEIFCRTVISSGAAFALRVDTGEQIFVPSSVVRASGIDDGDTAFAILAPNKHEGDSTTPWFCIRIIPANNRPAEPAEPRPPVKTLDDRALSCVVNAERYLATAEVAADLGTDTTIAHNALLRLFNQGKIAKADVYGAGGQSRPSFCLWAASAKDFVGADE